MTVSDDMRGNMFDQEAADGLLILLTLDSDELTSPIRVVNDHDDVSSRGNDFIALPFKVVPPDSHGDKTPVARIEIDNISREIMQAVRLASSPVSCLIEVVRISDPDTVEVNYGSMYLVNVVGDATMISGDLEVVDFNRETYPQHNMVPGFFPGIFTGVIEA